VRGWALVALARRAGLAVGLTAAASLLVWLAPTIAVTVGFAYPAHPMRGVGIPEAAGVLLASVLPALSVTAFSPFELLSRGAPARVLTGYTAVSLVLPVLPFLVWTVRVPAVVPGTQLPSPWPFVGSLLMYSAVAVGIHQLTGPLWGPIVCVVAWLALVLAQHWSGPSAVWGLFSTGRTWQTNWAVVGMLVLSVLVWAHRHHGVPLPSRRRTP
jgi:hypothetical protein